MLVHMASGSSPASTSSYRSVLLLEAFHLNLQKRLSRPMLEQNRQDKERKKERKKGCQWGDVVIMWAVVLYDVLVGMGGRG